MLKVISLYSGVGGLDFGFEAAGFQTAAAVEIDSTCCATIRLNRDWNPICRDIRDVPSDEILERARLKAGEPDILIGGPPCQPFSKTSYWVTGDANRLNDPRSGTLGEFLRVLRETKPKAFLLENVHGLAFKSKDEGLNLILKGIEEVNEAARTNYQVSKKVLNAADYGVPQFRERIFLIASREGEQFNFPPPTHGDPLQESNVEPYRTAWDAIGDLPEVDAREEDLEVTGQWADLLPSIPEGQNYLWHTSRGGGKSLFGWRTRYWSFLLKLAKAKPSWTIQASPGSAIGPFHWKNRKLSSAELCRLQTFPDNLKFQCKRGEIQRMLGNAVPSLLAEFLAVAIREQLFKSPRSEAGLTLMPKTNHPIPGPEPVAEVPEKYALRIKAYAAHPGEGKGPRSTKLKESNLYRGTEI